MTHWTHAICRACWDARDPAHPLAPERDGQGALERCCFCLEPTRSGVYVRATPETVPCHMWSES